MNETFRLINDRPKQPHGDFPGREPARQTVLFTGLDLPGNTRMLFETVYAPNEPPDASIRSKGELNE